MSLYEVRFVRALSVLAAGAFLVATTPVIADDTPAPRIDCSKQKNKKKPQCQNKHGAQDDEVINGAYWLAHVGKYTEAQALLAQVSEKENPRFLNAMGFTTRKLGNVEAALPYYARALDIEPNYVQAREYLGEAFLAKDDLASARGQLDEIARRAGEGSVSFANLKREITAYEAKRVPG